MSAHVLLILSRLTICRMRNRRFSKDIRAINFRFRKEDPQKVDKVYLFQFWCSRTQHRTPGENRTRDFVIKSSTLSQLSYRTWNIAVIKQCRPNVVLNLQIRLKICRHNGKLWRPLLECFSRRSDLGLHCLPE